MLAAWIVMPNIMPNDMRVKQKVTLTRDFEPCDESRPWRHTAILRTFDSWVRVTSISVLEWWIMMLEAPSKPKRLSQLRIRCVTATLLIRLMPISADIEV